MQKVLLFGKFKVESVADIKNASDNLENKFNEALKLEKQVYPEEKDKLISSIKTLTDTKEKYENKTKFINEDVDITSTQIEIYKVEFLWTTIGNYAEKEGVNLTLDLQAAQSEGVYDLAFTITGGYIGITNFVYDIENDERLDFKIDNFMISPGGAAATTSANEENNTEGVEETSQQATNTIEQNTTNTTTNTSTTTSGGGSTLTATFTVVDIGITLDD